MSGKDDIKEKVREQLLPELKAGKLSWYYISSANADGFQGGFFLRACGSTDAWHLYHFLGFHVEGCSTQTYGPLHEEVVAKIPEEYRWRRLNREEVMGLGA